MRSKASNSVYISKYENRRAYYDAFTSYHKDGDLVPMLGIFAEREHQRLLEYLSAIG